MDKNLPLCFEEDACFYCRKIDCKSRVHKSGYSEKIVTMCDGNCQVCDEAVRFSIYTKLGALEGVKKTVKSCLMYQYSVENQSFEFCGRVGNLTEYSKIELAILQLRKCEDCEKANRYYGVLKEISLKMKEIPHCFECMTDLTSAKALSSAESAISEVLENKYDCKTKTVLKRLIKQYLANDEDSKINFEKMCEYIISNQSNIDYYIHPLTIKAMLEEL